MDRIFREIRGEKTFVKISEDLWTEFSVETKKSAEVFDGFSYYQDLESQASASVVSSAAGASSVASALSAAAAASASALLFANSAIRASLTLASASNLSLVLLQKGY